jgi:hypothetical protein
MLLGKVTTTIAIAWVIIKIIFDAISSASEKLSESAVITKYLIARILKKVK